MSMVPGEGHRTTMSYSFLRCSKNSKASFIFFCAPRPPNPKRFSYSFLDQTSSRQMPAICLVPGEGLEPSCPKTHDFESCASTNSATPATYL
jgi:hypothetical protein